MSSSMTKLTPKKSPKMTKQKFDAFDAIAQFQLQIMDQKPPVDQMKHDIQMNSLSIRPFVGDVFDLNMDDQQFIEALWCILKLDEYVMNVSPKLGRSQITQFYRLISHYRDRFQQTINQIDMRLPHARVRTVEQPVAIEIFRDRGRTRRRVH